MEKVSQARRSDSVSLSITLTGGLYTVFTIPNPLHPAIVHFPIVLLLVGAAAVVLSVFINRWHLPWVAAVLLGLGAIGCFVAVRTGEAAQEAAKGSAQPEALIDAHESWAERTQMVGAITAILAVGAAVLSSVRSRSRMTVNGTRPRLSTGRIPLRSLAVCARVLVAVAALALSFLVYETARRGGELVYTHGIGVRSAPSQATGNTSGETD
jgi:uncharacterized membrane protein